MSAASPLQAPAKTVSLVLGGGGARGLAHIGVIRWLTDNGYSIRSIAGTSMGALIGGIHACGKLEVYAKWVSALQRVQVLRLLDPTFNRDGMFKGDRIIGVLRDLIGDCRIEELRLRYTAVATDLVSGEEVWLREGSLFDAIRASMATPLVFTPVRYGDRVLVDGALVDPLPVEATVGDETGSTIAVNLNGPALVREPAPGRPPALRRVGGFIEPWRSRRVDGGGALGMRAVALQSMQTMHDTITRLRLAAHAPDVVIEIPRNACAFHEFWRAVEIIELGRERAGQALSERR